MAIGLRFSMARDINTEASGESAGINTVHISWPRDGASLAIDVYLIEDLPSLTDRRKDASRSREHRSGRDLDLGRFSAVAGVEMRRRMIAELQTIQSAHIGRRIPVGPV
jgi:hypothetical protein